MRIKFLCRRFIPGEAWTNRVLAYAKGLAELECVIELYYLISDCNRTPNTVSIPGVRVICLWEKDNRLESRFRVLSYLRNLIRFRSSLSYGDKVFVYGAEDLLLKASYKKGVDVFAEITEHPYLESANKLWCGRLVDRRSRRLNKLKGLFVISNSLRDYFITAGVDENKIFVSNMIVDPTRFEIKKDSNTDPYIAYCGVVSIDKDGVDTLIKSFALFHRSHPEYKLSIIGRFGSSQVQLTLERLLDHLGIHSSVSFTGQVPPEVIPRLLVNAKVLALSRPNNLQSQNGFPTKLGEYLSTGNPVVVTSVGEIPLFIKDGYNAYLSEPDNPEEFAMKLCYVVEHYEEALEVGKRGKQLTESSFSYKSQSRVLYTHMS